MNRIKAAFIGFTLALLGLWLLADTLPIGGAGTLPLGAAFTQLTGVLSIGMMSFGTLLSIRPKWLEPAFDGLDKMYRLHKWLGVSGLAIGIVHWLTATGDGHGPRSAQAADLAGTPQSLLDSFRGPAHGVAQPALWVLIALITVALLKFIPYRFFAKTHILVAILFGLLAFHSVVLMKAVYWTQPIGWATLALVAIGVMSTLIAVLRRFGLRTQATGTVVSTEYYPELRVLETEMKVDGAWPGHEAGQFAFVTTDWREGPHPYTIATAWDPNDRRIGFIAKELGDHTKKLREHFTNGKPVRIEGPYGRFAFDDGKPRQIWIGAGIGITPFVAKMRQRANIADTTIVDLFHSTADVSETALAKMRSDAAAARVNLHITISGKDGKLSAARIRDAVPGWTDASVWFCGPTGFGSALKRDFKAVGLHMADFHQELFEMR